MAVEQKKSFQIKLLNGQKGESHYDSLLEYYGFSKGDIKKYPVVSGILKKITLEVRKNEVEKTRKTKLPKELQKYLNEYKKVGGKRDEFAWKILFNLRQKSNYLLIAKDYGNILKKVQFLITVFIVLVDDVADQNGNNVLLNELLKIPSLKDCVKYNKLKHKEKLYLHFSINIWDEITSLVKKFPRHKELKKIFEYDINQMLNAMKYDYIINKNNYLINKTEYWLYSPHSMQFVMTPSVDLMCSLNFNVKELGILREIFWKAQKMAKIGNWISTWRREVVSRDFSSGVFAYAVNQKNISVEYFKKDNYNISEKIKKSKIESVLFKDWENYYWEIFNFKKKIKSLNVQVFLIFLENLLTAEIVSEKYK